MKSKWVDIGGLRVQAYAGNKTRHFETGVLRFDVVQLRLKSDKPIEYLHGQLTALSIRKPGSSTFEDVGPAEPLRIPALSQAAFSGDPTTIILAVTGSPPERLTVADHVRQTAEGSYRAAVTMQAGESELGTVFIGFDWTLRSGIANPTVTLPASAAKPSRARKPKRRATATKRRRASR